MFSAIRNTAVSLGAATLALAAGVTAPAQAGYVVTLEQVGHNVVATGSGTIDPTDLFNGGDSTTNPVGMEPFIAQLITGPTTPTHPDLTIYSLISGPGTFGSGGITAPSSGAGDAVGIIGDVDGLFVPAGYVSDSPLSDKSTYDNQTLASLGVTPGTYKWTWGTGAHADSFTLDVVAPAVVPEPASLTLLAIGLAGLGVALRRRA